MRISEIQDKELWNRSITSSKQSQLLLSWEWGIFQQSLGKKVLRFGCFNDKEELVALFPVIKNEIPLNLSYLYSPRSPLILKKEDFDPKEYTQFLKQLADQEKSFFFKTDLLDDTLTQNKELKKVEDLQPSKTLMLDLSKSEEDLLKGMHNKTRYNIKVAQRHEVEILRNSDGVDTFMNLLKETTARDNFNGHSDSYYTKLLELGDFTQLVFAQYKGKVIAGNLMIYFGDTVTYLHGVSSNEDRNVMAPYLLHWNCIQDAMSKGYRYYDFWGINERKWPGVTAFKRKFVTEGNGVEVTYPGTYDLVINPLVYNLYKIYKKF